MNMIPSSLSEGFPPTMVTTTPTPLISRKQPTRCCTQRRCCTRWRSKSMVLSMFEIGRPKLDQHSSRPIHQQTSPRSSPAAPVVPWRHVDVVDLRCGCFFPHRTATRSLERRSFCTEETLRRARPRQDWSGRFSLL